MLEFLPLRAVWCPMALSSCLVAFLLFEFDLETILLFGAFLLYLACSGLELLPLVYEGLCARSGPSWGDWRDRLEEGTESFTLEEISLFLRGCWSDCLPGMVWDLVIYVTVIVRC